MFLAHIFYPPFYFYKHFIHLCNSILLSTNFNIWYSQKSNSAVYFTCLLTLCPWLLIFFKAFHSGSINQHTKRLIVKVRESMNFCFCQALCSNTNIWLLSNNFLCLQFPELGRKYKLDSHTHMKTDLWSHTCRGDLPVSHTHTKRRKLWCSLLEVKFDFLSSFIEAWSWRAWALCRGLNFNCPFSGGPKIYPLKLMWTLNRSL